MSKALYVHVPFCRSICAYCDFCRVRYEKGLVQKYLGALKEESGRYASQQFETIYVGGGTPSALELDEMDELLKMLDPFALNAKEYTLEINPESFSRDKAELCASHGVNRISMGIQTFSDDLLKRIERRHTADDIEKCLRWLRKAGIHNISCDLLYGLPGQSVEDFLDSLKKCVELGFPHISFYMLTIEPNSRFGRDGVETAGEELSDEMYFCGIEYLEREGYHQYEISNFAREGHKSLHNQVYWRYEDYAALGLGAAGKENGVRYQNTSNFVEYLRGDTIAENISLTKEDLAFETLMMGLRLKDGFQLPEGIYGFYREKIEDKVRKGELSFQDGILKAEGKYYYLLNDVLVDFLPDDE